MDLSKISIKLRPRNGYAAIDLGTRMAQRNWRQMILSCLIFTLPLYLFLLFLMPGHPLWVAIIIWWLKPLWERPLLLILSQDVFHQNLSLSDILRNGFKLLFKQLIPSISWRRFSPTRSFDAPVMQLENLAGQARSERLSALHSRSPSSISGMTFMMHLVEGLIAFGIMTFILQFIPMNDVEWTLFLEELFNNTGLDLFYLLLSIGWYIAMLLIAPFYVAGGFSSYLNQRSIREAWDLELIFRQLARKHKNKKFDYQNLTASILLCLFLLPSPNIFAAEPTATALKEDAYTKQKHSVKATIKRIQEGPDYKRTEQTFEFRRINPAESDRDKNKEKNSSNDPLLSKEVAKLLSWLFLAALVIYLLLKLPAIIDYFSGNSGAKNKTLDNKKKPEQLFGLDLKQESLPDDVVTEALNLWQAQQAREALGLLYRASLSKLIHEYDCEFEDGFTELECYQIVHSKNLALTPYFEKLTQYWRLLAYGHQLPSEPIFLSLLNQWPNYFEAEEATSEEVDHEQ